MKLLGVTLLLCLQGCSSSLIEPVPTTAARNESKRVAPHEEEDSTGNCIASVKLHANPSLRALEINTTEALGGMKGDKWAAFQTLAALPLDCDPNGQLENLDQLRGITSFKAVAAGISGEIPWALYIYRAEELNGEGLYGYMTSLVRFDEKGHASDAAILSQYMAYEGFVRLRSSVLDGRIAKVCDQEAELFQYDQATGDVTSELETPVLTEKRCKVIDVFSPNPAPQ